MSANLYFLFFLKDPTQVCCSTPKKPFISYQELILLYNGYTKLADLLRKSGGGIKMLFQMLERYVLFAWITTSFELYCGFLLAEFFRFGYDFLGKFCEVSGKIFLRNFDFL